MATRKKLFNIEYISDHSCGTYRIGEIDTCIEDEIKKYLDTYGEFGYGELRDFAIRLLVKADSEIKKQREAFLNAHCSGGG